MKTKLLLLALLVSVNLVQAQDKLLGVKISAGKTITHVKDLDTHPSGGLDDQGYLRNPADGSTYLVSNSNVISVGANLDLGLYEKLYFSTGLWFSQKGFRIGNQDAAWNGSSQFNLTYIQFPLAAKVYFKDVATNLDLYLKLGVTIDLKAKEALSGDDYSHYWNLAKNYEFNDPTRGKNADHKSKALFSPVNVGILGSFGAEYRIIEELYLFGGISYNAGLLNLINPSLRHDDRDATKVADGLKVTADVFSVDLGVIFPLK